MPVELRHLTYFVAVAEERHFGNAARRLRMAQPPLSQQIKAFEAQLGVTLFERTTRSVSLTPAGEFLLERAQVLMADLETLQHDVQQVHAGARGILRLGSTGSAAYRVLPRLLRRVRSQIPGLELQIQGEILNPEILEKLRAHRFDVALLRLPVNPAGLNIEVIQSDPLHLALPEDHRLAAYASVEPEELRYEPLVSYPRDSAVAAVTAEICRTAGFQPQVLQVVNETSTLVSLVAGGGCAAVVPEPVSSLGTPGVVFRPLAGAPPVDLALAWRSDDQRPLLHALIELVRQDPAISGSTSSAGDPAASGTAETDPRGLTANTTTKDVG